MSYQLRAVRAGRDGHVAGGQAAANDDGAAGGSIAREVR